MSFVNAPVHDMLIRIKNAYIARKQTIEGVVYSKFKENILQLLKKYKFIKDFQIVEDWIKKYITIHLKEVKDPTNDIPVIKFYSKPSRRVYVSYQDLKPVAGWRWIWIISTNKWVLPAHIAKKEKVGWELIAEIY